MKFFGSVFGRAVRDAFGGGGATRWEGRGVIGSGGKSEARQVCLDTCRSIMLL